MAGGRKFFGRQHAHEGGGMRERRCRDSSLGFTERGREGEAADEAMAIDGHGGTGGLDCHQGDALDLE
jgi:hypothetical protein